MAVAELLLETGSVGADAGEICAVLVSVEAVTGAVTVIVIVSVAPTARTPMLQLTVALPVQVTPAGTAEDETKVVLAGMVSVSVALVVATAPKFVTWIVYTSAPETNTGVGAAEIETARSAPVAASTSTDEVVALFEGVGSEVDDVASAVFRIVVPDATPATTFTT
jgi:hypothetical protein